MKLILGTPGSGKTKELLRLSALNNVVILAENTQRANRLLEKAVGYGYKIPTPITKEDLNDSIKEVYVDDVKILLESLLNVSLGALVVNEEENCEIIKVK